MIKFLSERVIKFCIITGLLLIFLESCSYLNKKFGLPDDNFFEETIENNIKNQTGIDCDLTPETPEEKW